MLSTLHAVIVLSYLTPHIALGGGRRCGPPSTEADTESQSVNGRSGMKSWSRQECKLTQVALRPWPLNYSCLSTFPNVWTELQRSEFERRVTENRSYS